MEKITQISINSVLFSLEETAFNKLKDYIDEIRTSFENEVSGQEIIKDIEARIAEHLKDSGKEVISIDIVEDIMSKMGTVDELSGKGPEDKTEKTSDGKSTKNNKDKKRTLFRDEDNAILGGVCAGIAAYIDVDVVWVRIAFIALIFLGFGAIIPIYIILWLIIPAAETTADKLEMNGNVVTLNTIANTVRDRVNEFSGKACKENKEGCKENVIGNSVKKTRNFIKKIFGAFGRVIVFGTGAILAFLSLAVIIGSAAGITAAITHGGPDIVKEFLTTVNAYNFIAIGIFALSIFIIIPSLLVLIGGLTLIRKKPIFQIRYGLAIFGIWIISLITLVVLGTHFGMKYINFVNSKQQMEVVRQYNPNNQIILETVRIN